MKKKINKWLFNKLVNNDDEAIKQFIYDLVKSFYNNAFNFKDADRDLNEVIFNAKYISEMKDGNLPSDLLQDFYARAGKGDRSFITNYFYKVLKYNGDKHIGKLKYKLKRNLN